MGVTIDIGGRGVEVATVDDIERTFARMAEWLRQRDSKNIITREEFTMKAKIARSGRQAKLALIAGLVMLGGGVALVTEASAADIKTVVPGKLTIGMNGDWRASDVYTHKRRGRTFCCAFWRAGTGAIGRFRSRSTVTVCSARVSSGWRAT